MIHFFTDDQDVEAVFGPYDESDKLRGIDKDTDLSVLARIAQVFPSSSAARRAGCTGPIPHGLNIIGTKKKRFWVWNPHGTTEFDHPLNKTARWFNG